MSRLILREVRANELEIGQAYIVSHIDSPDDECFDFAIWNGKAWVFWSGGWPNEPLSWADRIFEAPSADKVVERPKKED